MRAISHESVHTWRTKHRPNRTLLSHSNNHDQSRAPGRQAS